MPQILPDCVSSPFLDELETRRSEIEKSLKANFESEVSNGRTLGGRFLYFNGRLCLSFPYIFQIQLTRNYSGWRSINVQSAFKSSVFAVMAHIFFGEMGKFSPSWKLAQQYPEVMYFTDNFGIQTAIEPEFSAALSRYPRDVEFSASTKQYAPSIIAPWVLVVLNFIVGPNWLDDVEQSTLWWPGMRAQSRH